LPHAAEDDAIKTLQYKVLLDSNKFEHKSWQKAVESKAVSVTTRVANIGVFVQKSVIQNLTQGPNQGPLMASQSYDELLKRDGQGGTVLITIFGRT
jgi:hypothetical protein